MMHIRFHQAKGSVLLITMMILLTILLGFAFIGAFTLRNEQSGVLTLMFDLQARSAASACTETAMDRFGRDSDYDGDETLDLGNGVTCTIRPITGSGPWTVETEATYENVILRERVVLSARDPLVVDSWEEVDSF